MTWCRCSKTPAATCRLRSRAAMTERYLAAFPSIDRGGFRRSAAILAAQRNAKIIGIFTRLWRRDGKPQYLGHIPRVWRLLEADLREPALAPAPGLARPPSAAGLPPHPRPAERGVKRTMNES